MDKKFIIFIILGLFVIVLAVILLLGGIKEPISQQEEAVQPLVENNGILNQEDGFEKLPIDLSWENPAKPEQSPPIGESQIPQSAIKIAMSLGEIIPARFEVQRGQEVSLAVTSADNLTHIFKFRDSSLAEVALGLAPGETRMITFYTPSKPGEYEFYCDVPQHANRGEVGVMIVK